MMIYVIIKTVLPKVFYEYLNKVYAVKNTTKNKGL